MLFTPWKVLSSQTRFAYRKWDYLEDTVELPNGHNFTYEYLKMEGSAIIVPVTADGRIIVIKQYRYLLNDESLEFPAGTIETGATALETAHKELREEVGYVAGKLEFVHKFATHVGFVQGYTHVFLATELEAVPTALEDSEQIEMTTLSPSEFDDCVRQGQVKAAHVLAAWSLVRQHFFPIA